MSYQTKLMLPSAAGQHYFRPDNVALVATFGKWDHADFSGSDVSADVPASSAKIVKIPAR